MMILRELNPVVSYWDINGSGHYFASFRGDEIMLDATNDADAIIEGAELIQELEQHES